MRNSDDGVRIKVSRTEVEDALLVPVGPRINSGQGNQLEIPSYFERDISSPNIPDAPKVRLGCEFRGELVVVTNLEVRYSSGSGITSSLLHSLALPSLVHAASLTAIPNVEYWSPTGREEPVTWDNLKTDYGFLAQMYWLEHVTQGSPRQALMTYLGMAQSTCNALIRRIKAVHPLPTPRTAHKSFAEAAARKP